MSEILQQIKDSFLAPEQKQELVQYLEEHGDSEAFYEMFSGALMKEIEKRRDEYKEAIGLFDARVAEVDEDLRRQREALAAEREKKIEELGEFDIEGKSRLIDEYDEKEQALFKEYKKKVIAILGGVMFKT